MDDHLLALLEQSARYRSAFLRQLIKEAVPGEKLSVPLFEKSFRVIQNLLCVVVDPETLINLSSQVSFPFLSFFCLSFSLFLSIFSHKRPYLEVSDFGYVHLPHWTFKFFRQHLGMFLLKEEIFYCFIFFRQTLTHLSHIQSCGAQKIFSHLISSWSQSSEAWEILVHGFLEAIQTWDHFSPKSSSRLLLALHEKDMLLEHDVLPDFVFGILDQIAQSSTLPLKTSPTIVHSQSLAFSRFCSSIELSLLSCDENKEWCETIEDYFRRSLCSKQFTPLERTRLLEVSCLLFPSYPFLLLELLGVALEDPDYRMRKISFEKLSRLLQETTFSDGNAQKSMNSKALRMAARHITKDPSAKVRVAAFSLLDNLEESCLIQAKGVVLSKLLDKDEAVRKCAKKTLCESVLFYLLEKQEQVLAFESILRFSTTEQDFQESSNLLFDWLEVHHESLALFLSRLNVYQSPAFEQICKLLEWDIEKVWRNKPKEKEEQ